MIQVQLAKPRDVPAKLNGYAVQRHDDITFVLRDDLTPRQIAEAIARMGAHVPVQAANGGRGRGTPTAQ